jgi:hypothetical protein
MLIPKDMIVERLRARRDFDGAKRANQELGEKVDTERDAELLASFDIDAQQLDDEFHGQAPGVG